MKKVTAWMLIAILTIFSVVTLAENVPDRVDLTTDEENVQTAFFSRNSAAWGMSVDEVKAIETAELNSFNEDGDTAYLLYSYANVSKYTADNVLYVFVDNQLRSAMYIFRTNLTGSQFTYLENAISQVYGEKYDITKETIGEEMRFCTSYDAAEIQNAAGWDAPNSKIRLALDSEIDIIYLDPEFSFAEQFNTEGL